MIKVYKIIYTERKIWKRCKEDEKCGNIEQSNSRKNISGVKICELWATQRSAKHRSLLFKYEKPTVLFTVTHGITNKRENVIERLIGMKKM